MGQNALKLPLSCLQLYRETGVKFYLLKSVSAGGAGLSYLRVMRAARIWRKEEEEEEEGEEEEEEACYENKWIDFFKERSQLWRPLILSASHHPLL